MAQPQAAHGVQDCTSEKKRRHPLRIVSRLCNRNVSGHWPSERLAMRVATATTVDEEEPQLLSQEITSERVASIDDALALIKRGVTGTNFRS
jgi:hypothetical protein